MAWSPRRARIFISLSARLDLDFIRSCFSVSPFQVCFFGAKNMAIPSSTACIESSACIFPDCWRRPPVLWVCGVCLNFFIFFWDQTHEPGDETYEPKMVIVSSRMVPSTGIQVPMMFFSFCGLRQGLEKCFGKRAPACLDAAWVYVCYTSSPGSIFQTWEVKRWDCWLSTEGSHPFVKTEGVSCDEKGAEYLYMVNCGQRGGGGPFSEALINASLGIPYGTGLYTDGWRQTG